MELELSSATCNLRNLFSGWRDSIAGKAIALYVDDLGFVPGTLTLPSHPKQEWSLSVEPEALSTVMCGHKIKQSKTKIIFYDWICDSVIEYFSWIYEALSSFSSIKKNNFQIVLICRRNFTPY